MPKLSLLGVVVLALVGCGARPPPSSSRVAAASSTTLTYLGVAGWELSSASGRLLVDPYVTRASVTDDSLPLVPDEAAIVTYTAPHADAILVSHSHYDHLLDVPSIAKRSGAVVVGTESTVHVASASGVAPDHVIVASGGDELHLGPFKVHVIAGLHSLTGQTNVAIPSGATMPLPARAYGEGGTLQYLVTFERHAVLFIGTANFIEENVRGLHPDVAVIAIGLRDKLPDYTCRLLRALGSPGLVLPNHFDSFRTPLHPGEPYDAETRADLDAFVSEVHSCAPATHVVVPLTMRPIAL